MSLRREAVSAISQSLSACSLDESLGRAGFRRGRDSLVYRRTYETVSQEVDLCFDLNPRYEPGAAAHLLPQVRLDSEDVIPVIAAMTEGLSAGRAFRGRVAGMVLRQQIQNLAPTGQRSQYWLLHTLDSADECVHPLKSFIEEWVLPFLEEYSSLESLVTGYERNDQRLPNENRFHLYVAACYVVLQSPRKAMDVLERRFGRAGARSEYSQAFEHISGLLRLSS